MERSQKVKSKILISTIGVFVLCFVLSGLAYGQDPNDPGAPDTLWIGQNGKAFGAADRSFPVPVEIFNDGALGTILLTLRVQEVSTFAKMDSVSFIDRLACDSVLEARAFEFEGIDGISPDSFFLFVHTFQFYCLPPGSGCILNLWFTADSTGVLAIDTCRFGPTFYDGLLFGDCNPDWYWVPVFVSDTVEIRECGDVNQDNEVGLSDVVYLINYVFKSGPEPIPIALMGDVNEDNNIDIVDVVFLINYLFKSGPRPRCSCVK
jgi:hypothetical protein